MSCERFAVKPFTFLNLLYVEGEVGYWRNRRNVDLGIAIGNNFPRTVMSIQERHDAHVRTASDIEGANKSGR